MKKRLFTPITLVLGGLLAGCNTTTPPPAAPPPSVNVSYGPSLVSMNIDARDYAAMADALVNSLMDSDQVTFEDVLALGPVALNLDGPYKFDGTTFQEKLQIRGRKGANLQFSFAVDSIKGDSASEERYKIMKLQWEQENAVDPQDLKTFGQLAKVDFLLFGRASSITSQAPDGTKEVTFTFNWKLGDCETGLLVWNDEKEITKVFTP